MLTSLGTSPSANASFQWGLSSGNYSNETRVVSFNGTGGPFVFVLSNLLSNTTYHFRAKGMGDGVGYGSDTSFTTAAAPQTAPPPFLLGWGNWGSGNTQFEYIYGVAVDASGYVYVADYYNHRVQKFTISGAFIEKWGSEGSGDGQFSYPHGIAVDTAGYVYVADEHNNRIQKFTSSGDFITKWGSYGIGDGQFRTPYGVAVDSSGYVYVADPDNNRIQKFTSSGTYITKWGNGQLQFPEAMAIDNLGNVYVADTGNNRVQKFTNSGAFIAGWGTYGSGNGQFWYPRGISADAFGNVYVAEDQNHRIQKFTSSGAFVGKWGYHGSGEGEFQFPNGVAADVLGNVYVADTGNNRIQVFATALQPSVTNKPADNITASSARLNGSLDSWGTSTFVLTNFEWGTASGNYTTENAPSVWGNGTTGNFSTHLTDLVPNTTYFFRTRAMGDGASYGVEKSFSTDAPTPPELPPTPAPLPPEVQWSQLFGGVNADMGWSIQQTTDGGYIITGFTFYPDSYSSDVYVIKTDASGNMTWSQTFGGAGTEWGNDIYQTTDGGYIIGGSSNSSGSGGCDVYLIKMDATGNITWSRNFGGVSDDYGNSVLQTVDSGYIISGYTMSFGAGNGDVWLIKTDASGNVTWSRTFGGTGSDSSSSVKQTADGGYILVGSTSSFGTGNWSDVWLIKADSSGNITWNKTFGGPYADEGYSVQQTFDGGYIIGGATYSDNGTSDVYLIKTDASGNMTWSRTFGGVGGDGSFSIQQTPDGGYIIGGYTDSFGAGLTDVYIIKTDASGNMTWNQTFGGANYDQGNSVKTTADGGYIISGTTTSYGAGNGDVWLIKLGYTPPPPAERVVNTDNATNITSLSATLSGSISDPGYSVNVSFQWGITSGNLTQETPQQILTAGGYFSTNLTILSANTTYYFRGKAVMDSTDFIAYGEERSFTTLADTIIPGDANGDGIVNALDITKVERIIVGLDAPTPGADTNLDGNVNALDVTKVERIVARLD